MRQGGSGQCAVGRNGTQVLLPTAHCALRTKS